MYVEQFIFFLFFCNKRLVWQNRANGDIGSADFCVCKQIRTESAIHPRAFYSKFVIARSTSLACIPLFLSLLRQTFEQRRRGCYLCARSIQLVKVPCNKIVRYDARIVRAMLLLTLFPRRRVPRNPAFFTGNCGLGFSVSTIIPHRSLLYALPVVHRLNHRINLKALEFNIKTLLIISVLKRVSMLHDNWLFISIWFVIIR